jgi:hypothetical protein
VLDVETHEVADTAIATSTALAVVIDGRLLPVLIVDRTPKQSGTQLSQTGYPLALRHGRSPPDCTMDRLDSADWCPLQRLVKRHGPTHGERRKIDTQQKLGAR